MNLIFHTQGHILYTANATNEATTCTVLTHIGHHTDAVLGGQQAKDCLVFNS